MRRIAAGDNDACNGWQKAQSPSWWWALPLQQVVGQAGHNLRLILSRLRSLCLALIAVLATLAYDFTARFDDVLASHDRMEDVADCEGDDPLEAQPHPRARAPTRIDRSTGRVVPLGRGSAAHRAGNRPEDLRVLPGPSGACGSGLNYLSSCVVRSEISRW